MSLYDLIAEQPGGLQRLAAARLRYKTLSLIQRAFLQSGLSEAEFAKKAGMRVRKARRIIHGDGNVSVDDLADLLYAAGYEAQVTLVPAGQPRREALGLD